MLSLTKIQNPTKSKSSSSSSSSPPSHHVYAPPAARVSSLSSSSASSSWTSYIPGWGASTDPPSTPSPHTGSSQPSSTPTSFRNPWASWHKPSKPEIWASFAWGADDDPSIALATSHILSTTNPTPPPPPPPDSNNSSSARILPSFDLTTPNSPGAQASRLLTVQKPDFSLPSGSKSASSDKFKAKATWLGHAGVFLQFPGSGTDGKGRAFNCVFDPIFSSRASPTAYAGPLRSYPPPCEVDDLPGDIDAVFLSHNHYDHFDEASLVGIWNRSNEKGGKSAARFFVPLGNGKILRGMGIDGDYVVEMDWWDGVELTMPAGKKVAGGQDDGDDDDLKIRVWCVPAQHNSSRLGMAKDEALWSGWVIEKLDLKSESDSNKATRVFFAGDTGYQFHGDPAWPPRRDEEKETPEKEEKYPACPAFREIRERIGRPDLLLLPISVGATFAYLKSFVPLPDSLSPFPRHSAGVMGANHMPPWDAVRVLREMTGEKEKRGGGGGGGGRKTVAMGIHWGTFVTDPAEVLKTLGQLEYACQRQGVRFARNLQGGEGKPEESVFVAVNHGESVCI